MTANDRKSYPSYLNKLADEGNNTYHSNYLTYYNNYCALTEKIEASSKAPKFKVDDSVRITMYKNIFSKFYTENLSREKFIINSVLKTSPWIYKLEDLSGEKVEESFYEREFLLSILQLSYYPDPDIHIRDKVKVVLDLSSYATKKELEHPEGIDTSDLAAKKDFIALKVKVV